MKKLSILVLKSFLGPFFLTFFLILFILLMQFVWKYLDDLIGKGLDWDIIAELLIFQSTNLVSMALPLAILLSSIMTFGNLAENYELVALKSSGLSLFKIMKPLMILMVFISFGAFLFSDYVTPYANLKSKSMLYDIVHQKPLMELKDGVFYSDLEGFSMRVGRKDVETDRMYDVLIYDHRDPANSNGTVIRAKEGVMDKTESGRYMLFYLYDGVSYTEQKGKQKRVNAMPHLASKFDTMLLRMDLSSLQFTETDEDRWTNNIPMQNSSQLRATADSLRIRIDERKANISKYLRKNIYLLSDSLNTDSVYYADIHQLVDSLPLSQQSRVSRVAYNIANNAKTYLYTSDIDIQNRTKYISKHWNEWHRKFTLSFACLLLFFIGAPLGAIIKKGGLGMPVLFSIIFFLIFHITSISGEKMSTTGVLTPLTGMWMSTLILLPFSVFLTYKAAKDSNLFDSTSYKKFWNRLFRRQETDESITTVS